MWLILPLIYVLAWKQTGSWRQGFNGTVGWILGYGAAAGAILVLDIGGFDGVVRATPDSPGAALAILGGFIGMWISNFRWRRRGGDPEREPGRFERAFRAMMSGDQTPSKKRRSAASGTQPPQPAPPPQRPAQQPGEAQYRHVTPYQNAPMQAQTASPRQSAPPPQGQSAQPQRPPTQPRPASNQQRSSPTADKYARATGRALGAMFGGKKPKSSKRPGPR